MRPHLIEVTCPHCGGTQQEPSGAVSTYCRSCSAHLSLTSPSTRAPEPRSHRGPGSRPVHCFRCGNRHAVSAFAKTTICPSCTASIEIGNLAFSSNASRPVDLRGTLTVRAGAHLNSSCVICTDAVVEGRISGTLYCENNLELHGSGRVGFQAFARSVRIGKSARLELGFPLAAGSLEVRGHLHGPVVCSDEIIIRKGGSLLGSFEARRVVVERGGILEGPSRVTSFGGDALRLLPSNLVVPSSLSDLK